jgi:small subunit ribosomal protein S5
VTKVVKGGKNLSFSALVVVGDGHGVVGFGIGKAKEVPSAIKKGIEAAKKNLIRVPLRGRRSRTPCSALRRRQRAAEAGARRHRHHRRRRGARGRRVGGITNIMTKSLGSANPHNVVRATIAGPRQPQGSGGDRADAGQGLSELTSRASA